jgi:hypothetical protein
MTRNAGNPPEWDKFDEMIGRVTALAVAEAEHAEWNKGGWRQEFEVDMLAAAGAQGFSEGTSEVLAIGSELGAQIVPLEQGVEVKLQLQGFPALEAFGGRPARLVSANGAIDYRLRFDTEGAARCLLSDTPRIREGLSRFALFFLQNDQDRQEGSGPQ